MKKSYYFGDYRQLILNAIFSQCTTYLRSIETLAENKSILVYL